VRCSVKRLQVDNEALYVSNYWSEVRVPLGEVSHFTQSYMSNPPTVTIYLKSKSPVGQRVVFIPKFRWVLFGTHPTVIELQALCDRANAQGGTSQRTVPVRQGFVGSVRELQAFCVFFCLLSILSAVTGIQSITLTDRVVITRHTGLGRLYSILIGTLFAAAFYGIHRRSLIAWKLGWIALAASFVSFVALGLSNTLKLPPPGCWIVSSFVVVGGAVVIVLWGLWWKRQRPYFTPQQERDLQKDDDA